MKRPIGRAWGIGFAAGLACLACCIVELGLFRGLGTLAVGVELSEFARFTPLLILVAVATALVVGLRHRRRRTRPSGSVRLDMPQVRPDASTSNQTHDPGSWWAATDSNPEPTQFM